MKPLNLSGLLTFALVGGIGFAIDGGILTLLSQHAGVNIYLSRLCSFTIATLITWLLNRSLVFKARTENREKKGREYGKYLVVQCGGALLNLGVFWLLITSYPKLGAIPIIPLAVGAVFGLVFNFTGARFWVFRKTLLDG